VSVQACQRRQCGANSQRPTPNSHLRPTTSLSPVDARPDPVFGPGMTTTTTPAGRRSHALSLPNLLTYGRIVAVPLVAACIFLSDILAWGLWLRWVALAVFIIAAITDYFDGYLARAWAQVSSIGRMLDPIADKLLVGVCLLVLAADATIRGWSLWAAIVILSREILVSGLREYLAELRVSVPVSNLAKWKTAVQLIAVGFLLAGQAGEKILPGTILIGIILLWISAILTIYTGWDYFRAGLRHALEDER
jgi:cardiolipin synthase (CMP-forming)